MKTEIQLRVDKAANDVVAAAVRFCDDDAGDGRLLYALMAAVERLRGVVGKK